MPTIVLPVSFLKTSSHDTISMTTLMYYYDYYCTTTIVLLWLKTSSQWTFMAHCVNQGFCGQNDEALGWRLAGLRSVNGCFLNGCFLTAGVVQIRFCFEFFFGKLALRIHLMVVFLGKRAHVVYKEHRSHGTESWGLTLVNDFWTGTDQNHWVATESAG